MGYGQTKQSKTEEHNTTTMTVTMTIADPSGG
jgi:hypothetical protein